MRAELGRRLTAFMGAALALLAAAEAHAYCRTTTCGPNECQAAPECAFCLNGGLPLYWPGGCASFSTQVAGSPLRGVSAATTGQLVENALAQWMGVDCGGQSPSLAIYRTQDVTCSRQEYNQDSPNANVWMYRDDGWPYADSGSTLALTTVTFNVKTGEIYDADVEINSVQNAITVGDTQVQADLESIITHEAGHFLGLSHSCDHDATMYATYAPGETKLRTLEPDDVAGICAIYPPGKDPKACDPTPRHGFSTECASPDEEKGCCTTAPGRSGPSGGAALAFALGAWVVAASRRRLRRTG